MGIVVIVVGIQVLPTYSVSFSRGIFKAIK